MASFRTLSLVFLLVAPLTEGLRQAAQGSKPSTKELEHFKLVNELRKKGFTCPGGRSFAPNPAPLKFDCRLWKASQLHSRDMAVNKYFDITSPDGRTPESRARELGIDSFVGNIAAGSATASAVLESWKKQDGVCVNMMDSSFTTFGIGYGYNSRAPYRHYWTQLYASDSSADQSCLDSSPNVVIGDPWTCVDKKPKQDCDSWVELGYCKDSSQYRPFMRDNCCRSCKVTAPKAVVGEPWICVDKEPKQDCDSWVELGYCKHSSKYRPFMQDSCCRSCKLSEYRR